MQTVPQTIRQISRRKMLGAAAGMCGVSLPAFLQLKALANTSDQAPPRKAKSCIILYCWGGMSHHETWDPKPNAPVEIRGEFSTIPTATPGIHVGEHIPLLAKHTEKLAIIRSIHHDDSAHGRGMFWNLTGHKPPRAGNIAPMSNDWPSLPAMISKLRDAPAGVPPAVRLPYPMVDNGTLQAGEYGGWLGAEYDPIVIRTQSGEPYGGVSRNLGSEVLELNEVDLQRVDSRRNLLSSLEKPLSRRQDFTSFDHFHGMAMDMLVGSAVRNAYDLSREDPRVRESYGSHLGGQSMLLALSLIHI